MEFGKLGDFMILASNNQLPHALVPDIMLSSIVVQHPVASNT